MKDIIKEREKTVSIVPKEQEQIGSRTKTTIQVLDNLGNSSTDTAISSQSRVPTRVYRDIFAGRETSLDINTLSNITLPECIKVDRMITDQPTLTQTFFESKSLENTIQEDSDRPAIFLQSTDHFEVQQVISVDPLEEKRDQYQQRITELSQLLESNCTELDEDVREECMCRIKKLQRALKKNHFTNKIFHDALINAEETIQKFVTYSISVGNSVTDCIKMIKDLKQARIEIPETDENPFRNGNQLIEGQDSNCIGSDSRPQLEIAHIYPKSLIIEELREIVNDQVQMAYLIKLLGNNICDVIIKLMQEKGYSFHDALTRVIYFHPDNVRIAPKGNIRKFDPDQCRTNREQKQLRISKLKISDFYLNDKIDYELIPPEWREEFSAKMIECHNIVERFKAIKKMKLPQPLYTKNLLTERYIVKEYVDYKLYKQNYYGGDFYDNRKQFNVCTGEINWIPGKEPDLECAEQTKRRGLNSFEQSPIMNFSLPYNRFVETNPQLPMEQVFEGYRTRVAAAAVKNLGNNVKSDEATYLLLALYSDQVIQINDKHNQHLAKLYKERVDLHGSARRKKDQEIEQYKKDHELNEREESGRLFSKTVDLDSYMDDQGNIKWHEIPQEKLDSIVSKQNIRLKIRVNNDGSQHAMVGIRTEDGNIDYELLDGLIQDKLRSKGIRGDNRCVLRSIMANGKYDELRNGGKSHEEALNEAAEYATSSRELKKYTNGVQTWTKANPEFFTEFAKRKEMFSESFVAGIGRGNQAIPLTEREVIELKACDFRISSNEVNEACEKVIKQKNLTPEDQNNMEKGSKIGWRCDSKYLRSEGGYQLETQKNGTYQDKQTTAAVTKYTKDQADTYPYLIRKIQKLAIEEHSKVSADSNIPPKCVCIDLRAVTNDDMNRFRALMSKNALSLKDLSGQNGTTKDGSTKRGGLNSFEQSSMMDISLPVYEYTMSGITKILALRSRIQVLARTGNVGILPNYYSFRKEDNNIFQIFLELRQRTETNVLVPLSLYDKHAVGIMFVAQGDGSGYKAFYLDPENTVIPEGLATIFKDNGYQIEQLPTEGQRYTNCGPEVIENFMLYLTGERLSQEDAIVNNSRLVEQELLSSSHDAEEASCLTLKDSYSKEEAVTVISNAVYNTQVSSDDYIIDNPTRYDIVTPQTIIDGVVVRADLGRKPRDVLLELVHDYRINQDYAEAILGEVTSIDIS